MFNKEVLDKMQDMEIKLAIIIAKLEKMEKEPIKPITGDKYADYKTEDGLYSHSVKVKKLGNNL